MKKIEPPSAKTIVSRSERAWRDRDLWKTVLTDAYDFACPFLNPYRSVDTKGPRPMDRMFDSTALHSGLRMCNAIVMAIMPPDHVWFDLKAGPLMKIQFSPAQIEQVNAELDKVTAIAAMILNSPGFQNAAIPAIYDMVIAGMGVYLRHEDMSDDMNPFRFEAVPQSEVSVVDGPSGYPEEIYRRRMILPSRIAALWDDATIPSDLERMATEENEREVNLIESTCRVPGAEKEWLYRVLWRRDGDDPHVLVERSYARNPWVVFRWMKVPGSAYGPSPVMYALPDIRTLNKTVELTLKNAALSILGMYLAADDGVLNPDNIVFDVGAIIPVARTGGSLGASLMPLETGRAFDIGNILADELRTSVRRALMDEQLPPLEGGARSATEIVERQKMLAQDDAGAYARLVSDFVLATVQGVVDGLADRGIVPPLKIDQMRIRVHVTSPISRSQQYEDVQKVVQWLEICRSTGGEQATLLAAKIEDILPWIADQMGVPAKLVRDQAERDAMQQQVGQIIAANQSQQAGGAVPAMAA